jgi:2-polyprenyl-3-methyl-5-hydroxy-6-metoxy-1,4-benzoquinol methylase
VKYSIGKASGVFIGEDTVVKIFNLRNKPVKAARGSYELCWARERECLKRLGNSNHFPKLIASHEDHLGLQMTQCGESLFHTWQEHNLMLYLDQVHAIADALEAANIQYFFPGMDPLANSKKYAKFPLSNFCIEDGHLSLIDFELANPVGSNSEKYMSDRLRYLYDNYNAKGFRQSLVETLKNPRISYESELMAKLTDKSKFDEMRVQNPREVYKTMTSFTQPSEKIVNEWKKYQKRYGMDQAVDRVANMKLANVCTGKTVVDIGCNDGYITGLVSKFATSATGVEPHVELSEDKPANVNWIRTTFNNFLESKPGTFDVLLSLAVSIQLRDFGGLTEQEIVNGYYSLLPVGGIVVHETQKLQDRPNNQNHTNAMIAAFKTKFVQVDHGDARGSGKREYYHFLKEA